MNNNVISFPSICTVRPDVPSVNELALKLYNRYRNEFIDCVEQNELSFCQEIDLYIALIHELLRHDWLYRRAANDR